MEAMKTRGSDAILQMVLTILDLLKLVAGIPGIFSLALQPGGHYQASPTVYPSPGGHHTEASDPGLHIVCARLHVIGPCWKTPGTAGLNRTSALMIEML